MLLEWGIMMRGGGTNPPPPMRHNGPNGSRRVHFLKLHVHTKPPTGQKCNDRLCVRTAHCALCDAMICCVCYFCAARWRSG